MKAWRHPSTCHKTKGYKTLRHETWDIGNDDNAVVEMGKTTEEKSYVGISSQMS
jgi:hypothetical protein